STLFMETETFTRPFSILPSGMCICTISITHQFVLPTDLSRNTRTGLGKCCGNQPWMTAAGGLITEPLGTSFGAMTTTPATMQLPGVMKHAPNITAENGEAGAAILRARPVGKFPRKARKLTL